MTQLYFSILALQFRVRLGQPQVEHFGWSTRVGSLFQLCPQINRQGRSSTTNGYLLIEQHIFDTNAGKQ